MSAKKTRRNKELNLRFERLEDRRVMAADLLSQTVGGVQSHDGCELSVIAAQPSREPDFWRDSTSEINAIASNAELNPLLGSADSLTGLSQVRSKYGFIGAGQTVAIIDSGIAWDHVALGGGLGSNYRVVGGWDFSEENDADPYDDGPTGAHGTHVAGIVGADRPGTGDDGVAPGVDLVGLRVFNDAGEGYFSWVESALQWVHQNRNSFENPITAVNLSLGSAWNATTVPSWSTIEDELAQLKADGIFISVSAGNNFTSYNAPGLSYPASSPSVVPVMSVDDNGGMSFYSQRESRAIAAPGRNIVSSVPDYVGNHNGIADDYASYSGASMAAPYIAGASVLIREAMEFVGYSNINEDTIYDHMMATATSFFDAATGQSYKRINVANAIDSLMPADEFGSTASTAYNLGALSGTSHIQGVIGTLSDVDCFRFTAAASGSLTFVVTTPDGLVPLWSGAAGTISGAHGETYTIQVVAGQTYSLGLATSTGIGHYDLAVQAPTTPAYTDWGTVTQVQVNNVSNSGTSWYHLQASRSGILTVEALYAGSSGHVDISVHNSNQQLLSDGITSYLGERADLWVTAGTDYFLRVSGSNSDVDLRVTNLISQVGTTLSIAGTSGADTIAFAVGTKQRVLSVNGARYEFTKTQAVTFNLDGGGGYDTLSISGSSQKEAAGLQVGYMTFSGKGVFVSALGVEGVTVYGGGGKDSVWLYDSAGNDSFQAYSDHAMLSGSGYAHVAYGFKNVYGYASTGVDTANLYDSAKKDVFRAYSDHAELTGSGYGNYGYGFDIVTGHASVGTDKAYLYDSPGNDVYDAYADHVVLSGAGFANTASGFDTTCGYASLGNDIANMHRSSPGDAYAISSKYVLMSGLGFHNYGYGFDAAAEINSSGINEPRKGSLEVTQKASTDAIGVPGVSASLIKRGVRADLGISQASPQDEPTRAALNDLLIAHSWSEYPSAATYNSASSGVQAVSPPLSNEPGVPVTGIDTQTLDHLFELLGALA